LPVVPETEASEGEVLLLQEVIQGLRDGKFQKVVALVGAGISVSAGLPDFRSAGGLYDQMKQQGFKTPMSVFTADFLREDPKAFYRIFQQLRTDHVNPTISHYFLHALQERGHLLRCYSQNIDDLETKAGLSKHKLVQAHGTMSEARCLECGKDSAAEELWKCWDGGKGDLPRCASPACGGLVRPSVTFFGEQLPERFRDHAVKDVEEADLLLIMGTSLSVEPVASLISKAKKACPRLLVNRHVPSSMQHRPWELFMPKRLAQMSARPDAHLLGECDDVVKKLIGWLEWDAKPNQS
jgi:NAD-dependent deacetylase sirtuin 2